MEQSTIILKTKLIQIFFFFDVGLEVAQGVLSSPKPPLSIYVYANNHLKVYGQNFYHQTKRLKYTFFRTIHFISGGCNGSDFSSSPGGNFLLHIIHVYCRQWRTQEVAG